MDWEIRPLVPQDASDSTLGAVHQFLAAMDVERDPEDPPRSLEYTIRNFRSFSLISSQRAIPFYAWRGEEVVGKAFIVVGLDDENKHLLWGDVEVLPDHRRQGIGRALFRKVVEVAEGEDRRLIMATTDSAVPAGGEFASRVGAKVGLVEVTSELRLSELNRELLAGWKNVAPTEEFRLLAWLGPCPEDHLEPMAVLQEVMNTAPKGELDYEDERTTPADIRESEAYAAARGVERWTLVAQHKASGDLAGFTEVEWHPDKPRLLTQNGTVVEPRYRRRGLGRWLKASMIDRVLQVYEPVRRIRTFNADSNEAMLKINEELGYRSYKAETEWQVETARAREYLLARQC